MPSFAEALSAKQFVVTAELEPPKGADLAGLDEQSQALSGRVDALVVADNPQAQARMDALTAARHLSGLNGTEVVLTLACRDRNRLGLTSLLLGAAASGLKNLLLVSGDFVSLGDHPQAKPVFDLDSVQALGLANELNQGRDLSGAEVSPATGFFAGACVSPQARPLELQALKLRKKIQAGARFVITMPITSVDQFKELMETTGALEAPVIAGIEVNGETSPEAAAALAQEIKSQGLAAGVHLSLGMEGLSLDEVLKALGR